MRTATLRFALGYSLLGVVIAHTAIEAGDQRTPPASSAGFQDAAPPAASDSPAGDKAKTAAPSAKGASTEKPPKAVEAIVQARKLAGGSVLSGTLLESDDDAAEFEKTITQLAKTQPKWNSTQAAKPQANAQPAKTQPAKTQPAKTRAAATQTGSTLGGWLQAISSPTTPLNYQCPQNGCPSQCPNQCPTTNRSTTSATNSITFQFLPNSTSAAPQDQKLIDALREATRLLDERANRAEKSRQYAQSDQFRQYGQQIRILARSIEQGKPLAPHVTPPALAKFPYYPNPYSYNATLPTPYYGVMLPFYSPSTTSKSSPQTPSTTRSLPTPPSQTPPPIRSLPTPVIRPATPTATNPYSPPNAVYPSPAQAAHATPQCPTTGIVPQWRPPSPTTSSVPTTSAAPSHPPIPNPYVAPTTAPYVPAPSKTEPWKPTPQVVAPYAVPYTKPTNTLPPFRGKATAEGKPAPQPTTTQAKPVTPGQYRATPPKTTPPKTTPPKTTSPKTTAPKTTAPKTTAPSTSVPAAGSSGEPTTSSKPTTDAGPFQLAPTYTPAATKPRSTKARPAATPTPTFQ